MATRAQIAVVGATGVVGRELLAALQEQGHAPEDITALASERSEGSEVEFADETLEVEKAMPDSFRGIALALFATPPEVSRTLCVAAQAAGAWVVDVSPAFRADPQVPLVLPQLGLASLHGPFRGRIISVPSPVTCALVTALEPLRKAFGVRDAVVTAMMGSSLLGTAGVKELEAQTASLLSGREPEPGKLPHRLAFNLIPQVGEVSPGSAWTAEEDAWRMEVQRLWGGGPDAPRVCGTAVAVPTFYGHALSLVVRLGGRPTDEQVRNALKGASGLKVLDSLSERVYPMPMLVTADPTVHVGRVRAVPGDPEAFLLFAAIDNAGRGAALNAAEVGQALLEKR